MRSRGGGSLGAPVRRRDAEFGDQRAKDYSPIMVTPLVASQKASQQPASQTLRRTQKKNGWLL